MLRFKEIDWRFSVVMATRDKKHMMCPKVTLNLTLTQENQNKELLIDCDYANLLRLKEELENAVKSLDSPLSKKVFKYMK